MSPTSSSDEQLAKRAIDVLRWDSTVPSSVHMTVDNGWLTLSGEVDWQFQRSNAEKDLRHMSGVVGITNNVTLRPTAKLGVVKSKIPDALRRNADLDAQRIQVDIQDGGTVTLKGVVDSWSERMAVERAAWSAPGVRIGQWENRIGSAMVSRRSRVVPPRIHSRARECP